MDEDLDGLSPYPPSFAASTLGEALGRVLMHRLRFETEAEPPDQIGTPASNARMTAALQDQLSRIRIRCWMRLGEEDDLVGRPLQLRFSVEAPALFEEN